MRICTECGREFQPSSGHKRCPRCRHYAQQTLCRCGRQMNKESVQCIACREVSGASNGNWKGGATKHHAGYVMVRVLDHPRAQNNGGYVFEHVLVMEAHLGRHLVEGETVHHRNGVKDDNRFSNLELWCRPQPTGIRAADALAWAREIIALYGDGAP